jgi:predicted transposase YdaD
MAMSEASLKAVLEEFSEKYGFTAEWKAKGWVEGWAEGWKKGWAEGREEGRGDVVRKMQKHGMDPGQIAEILELPPETVFGYLQTGA